MSPSSPKNFLGGELRVFNRNRCSIRSFESRRGLGIAYANPEKAFTRYKSGRSHSSASRRDATDEPASTQGLAASQAICSSNITGTWHLKAGLIFSRSDGDLDILAWLQRLTRTLRDEQVQAGLASRMRSWPRAAIIVHSALACGRTSHCGDAKNRSRLLSIRPIVSNPLRLSL